MDNPQVPYSVLKVSMDKANAELSKLYMQNAILKEGLTHLSSELGHRVKCEPIDSCFACAARNYAEVALEQAGKLNVRE